MNSNSKITKISFDKELRKKLAAFYTKPVIASLLSSLVIDSSNVTIIDPSCGSGNLLNPAIDRIKILSSKNNYKTNIIGIEISEESYNEAHKLISMNSEKLTVNIIHEDVFLLYKKSQNNSQTRPLSEYFLNGNNVIVLANPPFSKFQNTSPDYKKLLSHILSLDGLESLSLHSYFLELIFNLLPSKGKFGLILPVTTSYSNRGSNLVKQFFSNVIIEKILLSEAETAFSEDSNFQEMIVIGYKNKLKSNLSLEMNNNFANLVQIINLKKKVTFSNIKSILESIQNIRTTSENEYFSEKKVSQIDLISKIGLEGWNFLYRSFELISFIENIKMSLLTLESNNSISFKRGINKPSDFFFIPNKYFKIYDKSSNKIILKLEDKYLNQFKKEFHQIVLPENICIPIIRKPEFYKDHPIITNELINKNYFKTTTSKSATIRE